MQVVSQGANVCVFMTESDENGNGEISSFKYPGNKLVGNFSIGNNPLGTNTVYTNSIVASGGYLFAYFFVPARGILIATWQIESNCALALLAKTSPFPRDIFSMAATPDGKTLIVSERSLDYADSFSIGAGGVLTEHGPYEIAGQGPWGIDITADGKYALFDVQSYDGYTQVNAFVINADGSLGDQYGFGGDGQLGDASTGGWIRLSPDERFLFVTDGFNHVTTLDFTESPINLTYSGCLTTLKTPNGEVGFSAVSMATEGTMGAGAEIYVAEAGQFASNVGLLAIDSTTGCTTEALASPFILSDPNAFASSLVAWPPRPF